jgi:hypothetical protein
MNYQTLSTSLVVEVFFGIHNLRYRLRIILQLSGHHISNFIIYDHVFYKYPLCCKEP